jgi:multisubunit Na+/H+ antiporter MnhE subunit
MEMTVAFSPEDIKSENRTFRFVLTFSVMFIFWVLLSAWSVYFPEPYDFTKVSRGFFSALIVALLTWEIFVPRRGDKVLLIVQRLIPYMAWEIWQIYLAAVDVAKRILGILDIDPQIVEFDTPILKSDFAFLAFATSVTLTPGTVTILVDPERGRYTCHAIAKGPADGLAVDQGMQKYVAWVFMEEQKEGEK